VPLATRIGLAEWSACGTSRTTPLARPTSTTLPNPDGQPGRFGRAGWSRLRVSGADPGGFSHPPGGAYCTNFLADGPF
jgi:hypothetical protein